MNKSSSGGEGGGGENLVDWSKSYQSTTSSTYYEFASLTLKAGKKYVVKWDIIFDTNNTTPSYIDLLCQTSSIVSNQSFQEVVFTKDDEVLDVRYGNTSVDAINGTATIASNGGYIKGEMYIDMSGEGSDIDFTVDGRVGSGTLVISRYVITAVEVS